MFRNLMLLAGVAIAVAGCEKSPEYDPAHDYFTYANYDAFVTDHLVLDLDVDFQAQSLKGTASLHMRNLLPTERTVILDTRDLSIASAAVRLEGEAPQAAAFRLGERDEVLGQSLSVDLPEDFDPQGGFWLDIDYRTSPEASALQWLPAELTAGGKHPLVFSQSQAIHARSWVPLQDTPAVRITYEATLRTPPSMLALMSADNNPLTPRTGRYTFNMPQPIPSYLLAIAAGNLFFAPIGAETGVYSEPELLEDSAWEFAETQDMLDLAETQLGPYDWGRYDLLILPPSFPYGGMENPRLSFITPSVIAGDRSLVSLIAHELAHSWSGNLVTNATWRDIWLNEGTTSYLTARLMEDLYSKARADEERVLDWEALQADLQRVPERFQALAPKILPADGEGAQQAMYYAKGQFFLEHLERLFGRAVFDEFIMGYFRHFEWQSITTEQFLDYLDEHLLTANPGVYTREQAGEWLYQPGVPADFVPPVSASLEAAEKAAQAFSAGEIAAFSIDHADWSPHAVVHFINSLPPSLDSEQLGQVGSAFGFSQSRNAEISRAWFIQVAQRRYQPAYGAMEEHLARYGRMKLIVPVYAALVANGEDAALAERLFKANRDSYHPIAVQAIEGAFQRAADKANS
ncbi:M1 family metallopeptidase [Marinihelvus fidelis]|uniref:Aminopeptidase N n=1 Tax=Marinihelvus fidelis TaxID=2613842 RepID=A0A5N0T4J4_9GAMM|nr:M1 family metallopeptidase [Marinihelvus fidelis]KAA9129771.1 M1 family metallopeptidase [Marinihelvus fidelis]